MARTLSSDVHFHDIPDAIVSNIFSLITDTRTRNSMSLVCLKWHLIERSTRTSLTLRGNIRDLFLLPTCFRAVTDLDLSFLSPWGHPIFDSSSNPKLLAQLIHRAFPSVVSLTVYARNPSALQLLAPQWPGLSKVKLVRWHQRSPATPGSDFVAVFEHNHSLNSLDLSHFYCWTEDLPPALEAYPSVAASITHLNVLAHSSAEGFKSHELLAISAACPNLCELLATCVFDPRFIGFVGDETLLSLASNCPRLSLLHLVRTGSLCDARGDPDDEGYTSEDARISHSALADMFAGLPLLEELVLDVCHNVRDTWPAWEVLNSKCPRLKFLKLGRFHGICRGIDARPDGIAICSRLESLSIKNSADLTDSHLISISFGCPRLAKFEVQGCKRITEMGMNKLASILQKSLVDVKISCCKYLNAVCSLRALEPIQDRIQRLHIDCVWENVEQFGEVASFSGEAADLRHFSSEKRGGIWEDTSPWKRRKTFNDNGIDYQSRTWARLEFLSLWIPVGELLTPLTLSGLENCPVLEEIKIKVEGDCRHRPSSTNAFGLSSLACYPRLWKMSLNCGSAIGTQMLIKEASLSQQLDCWLNVEA
uniref:COI1 F-box domain-containing protein n=1 Tax=Manihot esculenta TaxID=3983 RepID=A0A2C9U5E0_MANES